MAGCVWYSFGSDKTGPILAERLGFDHSKRTPAFEDYDILIGWGCKPGTKYKATNLTSRVTSGRMRLLNHPEAVKNNRNKLETLKRLSSAGIAVPGFFELGGVALAARLISVLEAVSSGVLAFPLVGYTQSHRGEPVFCYAREDVAPAIQKHKGGGKHPLAYFRTLDQGAEFRIHVFRDTALFGQSKVLGEEPVRAVQKSLLTKLDKKRKKDGNSPLTSGTRIIVAQAVEYLAGDIIRGSTHLKKSPSFGWKYTDLSLVDIPPEAIALAINALDAAGLDMGAVSVSYGDSNARVLGITTAPALTDEQMNVYVEEIQRFSGEEQTPPRAKKKEASAKPPAASVELRARLKRGMVGLREADALEMLKILEG